MNRIELGDEVRHKITGFKGVAVVRANYISGCNRITIQPKVNKNGEVPEEKSFDEPEIEIIKRKKVKRHNENGGWKPAIRHYLKS